jgi:hypothetical protein
MLITNISWPDEGLQKLLKHFKLPPFGRGGVGFIHHVRQLNKLRHGELLRPAGHHGLLEEAGGNVAAGQERTQTDAEHLAALVEDGLDDAAEELFVTAQRGHAVARHADDGALDLGRRIEDIFVDGEEIFHVVPCLNEHAQYAVGLAPRRRGHAQGDLALDHARTAGYEVFVIYHLEEYLGRNVVGVVARQDKLAAAEKAGEIHAEEVLADDIVAQTGEMLVEIDDRLAVYLNHADLARLLHEILCEHSHAGADLQNGQVGTGVHRVGDAASYVEIGQKVLAEILFGSDLLDHRGKGT